MQILVEHTFRSDTKHLEDKRALGFDSNVPLRSPTIRINPDRSHDDLAPGSVKGMLVVLETALLRCEHRALKGGSLLLISVLHKGDGGLDRFS